jgi:8-oxo-dGTP pyrophosphatase MutT (NUDIX family)
MEKSADFEILHDGIFREENLHCVLLEGSKIYSEETERKVENIWKENSSENLFNGDVFSLIKSEKVGNELHYWLQKTEYKYFYGTNLQKNPLERADILAVCAVIETSDDYILLGKRSENLAESALQWHVIGGSIDAVTVSQETAFFAIQKEISEETGISNQDLESILCLGLGKNNEISKPEFLFFAKLKITKKTVEDKLNSAIDKKEHSRFTFLPKNELADFVRNHSFSTIGRAAVYQYLRYREKR